jgi:hypothetical protein
MARCSLKPSSAPFWASSRICSWTTRIKVGRCSRKFAPGFGRWHHAHRWKGSGSLPRLPASRWDFCSGASSCASGSWPGLWPPVVAIAWPLGWTVTWAFGIDVERGYYVFGSTGALVFAAVTGLAMLLMLRGRTR